MPTAAIGKVLPSSAEPVPDIVTSWPSVKLVMSVEAMVTTAGLALVTPVTA
ncbi:hypothetical protein [Sinorhizobium medicae]|uniref:hypothetical protein n=1 Tax=Sinorhizobium medicae TaxID=110321 RepID=UPI002B1BD9D3|nr:hypothetical protein [Sinorhizobium medicae]